MFTFPDYDYPMTGGTESAEIDATVGTENPNPEFTLGVFLDDAGSGLSDAVKSAASVPGKVYDKVTSTVRNTFLYTVGGIVIVGILAIVLLGAGTRFAGSVQGFRQ